MVISPGIILIPSNLIILDKMVPGYNNVLKLATRGMKFGKNDDVNYFEPSEEPGSTSTVPSDASIRPNSENAGSTSVPTSVNVRSTSGNTRPSPVNKELKSVRSEPKMNESELILLVTTLASSALISKFLI